MSGERAVARPVPQFLRRIDWAGLCRTRAYDRAMRLPYLAWVSLLILTYGGGLATYARTAGSMPAYAFASGIAMRLATLVFLVLAAGAVLARLRPSAKARGLGPRLAALFGSFLVYSFVLFPRRELSVAAETVSTLVILIGTAGAAYVLTQLGRSFSIMAEARRLVTTGMYRFVRHPLYLAEELAVVGVAMQFWSVGTALILLAQIAFQLIRMRNEEAVLEAAFPEYARYRERTARLIPFLY